jgi:hypothetical protein
MNKINSGCNTHVHGSNARNLLYSYPYLKLAKALCLCYYCLYLLFNKIGEEQVLPGSERGGREGEGRGRE